MNGYKKGAGQDKRKQAVALGYDYTNEDAPKVLASGQGHLAERIIELAKEHHIPLKEDPVLVEALGQLRLGEEIPPELYRVVAEILVFVMEMDRKH